MSLDEFFSLKKTTNLSTSAGLTAQQIIANNNYLNIINTVTMNTNLNICIFTFVIFRFIVVLVALICLFKVK